MSRVAMISGVLGGILVLSSVAYRIALEEPNPWMTGAGALGMALLVLYLWLDREELRAAAGTREAQFAATSAVMVFLCLGLTAGVNVLGDRYNQRWDMTRSGTHTLAPQTAQILQGLQQPVQILSFFPEGSPDGHQLDRLLEAFTQETEQLQVQRIDPYTDPIAAESYSLTSGFGTVILQSGEQEQRLESSFGEEDLANALVRLVSGTEHRLCFTTSHEERDPDDELSEEGLGAAVIKLEGQNYRVDRVVPSRDGLDPSCEVLVLADPRLHWLPSELTMLARYLAEGGQVLAMLEPLQSPKLVNLLADLGVEVGDDVVLEQNPSFQVVGGDASYLILTSDSFSYHPVVESLDGFLLLRVARSVAKGLPVEGVTLQELSHSTEQSWAETDLFSGEMPEPDEALERMGPVPLMAIAELVDPKAWWESTTLPADSPDPESAAPPSPPEEASAAGEEAPPLAAEAPTAGTDALQAAPLLGSQVQAPDSPPAFQAGGRLLVIGDVDWASNGLIGSGNNADLFLNTLAWMVGEENQISIRPRENEGSELQMTAVHELVVWGLILVIFPGALGGMGVRNWLDRRKL